MTQLEIVNFALVAKLGEPAITAMNQAKPAAQVMSALYLPTLNKLLRSYRWSFARKEDTLSAAFVDVDSLSDDGNGIINVEKAAHGRSTGDRVLMKDTETSDGHYIITVVDTDNFTLDDSVWNDDIAAGSYHVAPRHTYGYKIALPADCLKLRSVNGYEANQNHLFYVRSGNDIHVDAESIDVVYTRKFTPGSEENTFFDSTFCDIFACLLAVEAAVPITGAVSRRDEANKLFNMALMDGLRVDAFESEDFLIDKTQGQTSFAARLFDQQRA